MGLQTEAIDGSWPRWIPWMFAAAATALALLTPFVHHEGQRTPALFALLLLAVIPWCAPLVGVRLPPLVFGAAVWVPVAALNWAGGAIGLDLAHDGMLSLMILTLAVGSVACNASPRAARAYTVAALLVPIGRSVLGAEFDSWAFWAAGMLLAAGSGAMLRRLQLLVEELEHAQAALAEEAASRERQRIAREVHDVIAHSLTVTMLHLTAARMAIGRDTAEAEEALAEAEQLGRQALADVRQAVGLLRADDHEPARAALPAAEDLAALVAEYTAAGARVTLACSADLSTLTPAQSLAVYRTVQEGLANATKHAPGAAIAARIERDPDGVVIRITDDGGTGPSSGHPGGGMGLLGMRERLEAVGGTATAGPSGRGWEVVGRIPVGVPA